MPLQYGTSTSLACTSFNSLASINTTATAAASTAAATTSTTANVTDIMVRVKIVCPTFTPTSSTGIEIYAYGSEDGTNYPGAGATNEVLTGADAAVTLSTNSNNLRFLGFLSCHTTGATMTSQPMSLVAAFGIIPRKWAIVIRNALPATNSLAASGHSVNYTEIFYN